MLDERLAPPTWRKVIAYAGLVLALAAAIVITRATMDTNEPTEVGVVAAVP